ncbi:MAG: hypothetical protein ACE5JQ_14540 [Candidatus Methylomirabilales bacterium]
MSLRRMGLGTLIMVVILVGSAWRARVEAQPGTKQSVRGGGVTVAVTPLNEPGDAPKFLVSMNTHSVNLDVYEFKEIVWLRDGRGGELAPTAVKDAEGGGHHRSAILQFAWPEPKPKSLEVVVKGVAGVPERVFRWMIE